MKVEPLYGLPVEEPGDIEGWSINVGQPGDLLAVAAAAELSRLESDIAAFQARLDLLPFNFQAGNVRMPFEIFSSRPTGFYNGIYWVGAEGVVFKRPFLDPPAVILIPNNTDQPGFSIEATASEVSTSGFTARLAVNASFTGTFITRWIAVEVTQ